MKTSHTHIANPRQQAIISLVAVQEGTSLAQVLPQQLNAIPEKNRAFFHELVLGTLRHWFALQRITQSLAHQPVTEPSTLAAIHIGMYQLFYMRTPDHAAIGETVTALKKAGTPAAAGLVNALLRRCQKDHAKLLKKVTKNHSLPNWLAKQLKADWRPNYDELTSSLRSPAAIFLRVNNRKTSLTDYMQLLENSQINASVQDGVIQLHSRMPIQQLPHFDEGYVSVQDCHAQKAVTLFDDLTDKTVLDACAAPGGKTAQLLENYDVQTLTAIDVDNARTLRIADNLSRLSLLADNVHISTHDASTVSTKELGKFDAILLDAPCTATGVIRRHPDISLLRQETDVANTVALQASILTNVWQLLNTGGELVYVTCSLLKAENSEQIAQFLASTADAEEVPLQAAWGIAQEHGRQCLPLASSKHDDTVKTTDTDTHTHFVGDGFYFAKLRKKAV